MFRHLHQQHRLPCLITAPLPHIPAAPLGADPVPSFTAGAKAGLEELSKMLESVVDRQPQVIVVQHRVIRPLEFVLAVFCVMVSDLFALRWCEKQVFLLLPSDCNHNDLWTCPNGSRGCIWALLQLQ